MNTRGRTCWRGVSGNLLQPGACKCRSEPPEFNYDFPVSDVSSVGQPSITDESGSHRLTVVPNWTDSEDFMTTTGITHTQETTHSWFADNSGSLKLLVAACISLFLVISLLVCVLVFFARKNREKRPKVPERPETEGCEADENICESTSSPEEANKNDFPLVEIDHKNNEGVRFTQTRTDNIPGTNPVVQSRPVLRTVKAKIVGNGSPQRTRRPIRRQDSTAPLVDNETAMFRDKWKAKSHGTNGYKGSSPNSTDLDTNGRYAHPPDRLSTLDEVAEGMSKEPTQLEILPSRHFPAPSIVDSPTIRRASRRPDSSTPLFDSDSIDS